MPKSVLGLDPRIKGDYAMITIYKPSLFPSVSVTFAADALLKTANMHSKSAHIADYYSVLEDGDLDLEADKKESSQ